MNETEELENEKLAIVILLVIYEYISVKLIGDMNKQGLTLKEIRKGDLINSFKDVMIDFETTITNSYDSMKPDEINMCKIIIESYKENGSCGTFYKDVTSAVFSNDKIKELFLENPILELFIPN